MISAEKVYRDATVAVPNFAAAFKNYFVMDLFTRFPYLLFALFLDTN